MDEITDKLQCTFPKKTIVILGDLVADQFLNGTIARVSREAPVFILRHDNTQTVPGAAANAAVNVASLGGKPVLAGFTGRDANGGLLLNSLKDFGVNTEYVIADGALSTTTKVRVLAGQHYAARQQVIRIDYEDSFSITDELREKLRQNLDIVGRSADAIIISDYNYNAVFPEIYQDALAISRERGIPLIVDSRFRLGDFPNATSATPNREEVEHILGMDFTADDCSQLRERLGYDSILVTNGNQGMLLFEKNAPPLKFDAVGSSEPVDVTGAGDTVIAAYALGLASGLGFADSAMVANHAGGIVVMKKGTAFAKVSELIASLGEATGSLASSHAK